MAPSSYFVRDVGWRTVVGGTENLNAGHVVRFYGHQEELSGRGR